jgi:hypothetical protein
VFKVQALTHWDLLGDNATSTRVPTRVTIRAHYAPMTPAVSPSSVVTAPLVIEKAVVSPSMQSSSITVSTVPTSVSTAVYLYVLGLPVYNVKVISPFISCDPVAFMPANFTSFLINCTLTVSTPYDAFVCAPLDRAGGWDVVVTFDRQLSAPLLTSTAVAPLRVKLEAPVVMVDEAPGFVRPPTLPPSYVPCNEPWPLIITLTLPPGQAIDRSTQLGVIPWSYFFDTSVYKLVSGGDVSLSTSTYSTEFTSVVRNTGSVDMLIRIAVNVTVSVRPV